MPWNSATIARGIFWEPAGASTTFFAGAALTAVAMAGLISWRAHFAK